MSFEDAHIDHEIIPTAKTRSSMDYLRRMRIETSLTGDKQIKKSSDSPSWPGSRYSRRDKAVSNGPKRPSDPRVVSSPDAAPTKSTSTTVVRSALNAGRTKVISASAATRFSFFNMNALRGNPNAPSSESEDDELTKLDIDKALFPGGAPKDGESFSPAAFKNLQVNASGLLRKFQSAYQRQAVAYQEVRSERDANKDAKNEVDTRTAHLKLQLEDMAQRASEAEAVMQALMDELNREKRLRVEEKAIRESGVLSSGMSTISEDLGAEDDQRKRARRPSDGTNRSDDTFDTDEESIDEMSVFSRSRSPTLAATMRESGRFDGSTRQSSSNSCPLTPNTKSATSESPRSGRSPQPQVSAFQKLIKGFTGDNAKNEGEMAVVHVCPNCQGQDASVAWDTASLLRDENRALKQRVDELENGVEDALDAVLGF